jgi:spermidine/putrescine transport system ATP-binding protein
LASQNNTDSDFAVEIKSVSKYYGDVCALDKVSLQIRRGEFFCLLGPSGCGKTTTLNIVGGFIPLTKGEVFIDGQLVTDDPPYRRNVNTVFQNYALFPHMTVAQNIGFGLRMKKVERSEINTRVDEMLKLISMEWAGKRRARQLSGGQQQRVALVRALINRPAVLLLDEPLGALDLKLRKQLQVELLNIQRKVGITFIHVTHDQEEAMSMSDRIAVMSEGKAVQIGSPSDIYYHPRNRFVADFIGESNFFAGRVVDYADRQVSVDVPGFEHPVRVPFTESVSKNQEVIVMIRPERIAVSSEPPKNNDNVGKGVLTTTSFMGMYTQLHVQLGDTLTNIFSPNQTEATQDWHSRMGQHIFVSWSIHDGNLLLQ